MELLVVSILMTIVMMITAQFWKWFSPCVSDLIARGHLLREARLTMQSLAYDFGNATSITGGSQLVVNGKIRYYRESEDNPNLYRRDIPAGREFTIADCVSDFSVREYPLYSHLWEITVEFQARSFNNSQPFTKEYTYHWRSP